MDTVTYAALGMGAIGTMLYGVYAASAGDKKRRSGVSKRSLDDERRRAADRIWASFGKYILNGEKTNSVRSWLKLDRSWRQLVASRRPSKSKFTLRSRVLLSKLELP